MLNLFEIMRQAQSGSGLQTIGQPFGLNVEQSRRAVEALLPAFSLAFRQATRNPAALSQLLTMMNSTRYLPFFEKGFGGAPGAALGGFPVGGEVVSQLFGPDEASRKVAEQASALTGIATGVLHQMMPTVAAVIMGGLFRTLSVEGLSDALRTWADWLATLKRPEPTPAGDLGQFYKTWQDTIGAMMGPGLARPPAPPPPSDPWSGMLESMFGATKPVPPPPPPTPNPFEALAKMFDTGREVQAQYLAGLQGALNGVWGKSAPKP